MSDSDIVAVLRECAADSRASEGDYYADQYATAPEIFDRAADEIARLRLTDAERSAIRDAADRYATVTPESAETAATLRGLLDRTGSR